MTDPTKDILTYMLKQNTGRHFLDSGGACGRNWEQNQNRNFESEKPVEVEFSEYGDGQWELIYSANVYHWLAARLEFDDEMDKLFHQEFVPLQDEDESWLTLMEQFPYWLAEHKGVTVGGIYGEGEPVTVNTYNGEDGLSQVLQYCYFELHDGSAPCVILQIHGGCDVRGGYTTPHVFRDLGELSLLDNAHAYMQCEGSHWNIPKNQLSLVELEEHYHCWYTDNAGYRWHSEDSSYHCLANYTCSTDPEQRGKGVIYYDSDSNKVYCPICGGELTIYV